jgi:hypothetical protein
VHKLALLLSTNAAFCQRSALTKKEMPIRPTTPGSNRFSPNPCPLAPRLSQMFAVCEVGIERLARFLDERDLAMRFFLSHEE